MAAEYNSGGSNPTSTTSGDSRYSGTPGTNEAATPTPIRHNGADQSSRRAIAVKTSTATTSATNSAAISTDQSSPGRAAGLRWATSTERTRLSPPYVVRWDITRMGQDQRTDDVSTM